MLEYLRNASEKPISKILISILAFSFVGWGVAEWIFGGAVGDNTLLRVGSTEITAQQFNSEKNAQLAQMTREEQRAVYADSVAQNAFNQQVFKSLATHQMIQNRANDLGFVVSDKRIAREIREFPEFQIDGKFSTFAFDSMLNKSGYTEAQFAEVLRSQVLRSMVLGAMSAPIQVPEFALKAAYNARYGTRDIEYATVKYSDFKVGTPTDEQLQVYYKQNPKILPETRAVSYILISGDLSQPDKYDAAYTTAVKIEDDIIAGETMKDAAKKHNAKYVDVKAFARDEKLSDKILTDAMVARIFDMEPGLESEMIETKDGFVFVRVEKVNPAHTAEFADVKKSLVSDWVKSEQKKQAYVRANELLVDLNQGGKLSGKKSANVSRTSGAPTDVLVTAFRNSVNQNSIVAAPDAFYVLAIKGANAPKADKKKMDDLRQELQNMSATGLQEDYNSFLIREYPVEINEKVYNRLFAK